MSEYKHDDSPEYIEMSPTRRYYNDVDVVRENLTSAIIVIDNFANKFPMDDTRLFTKMMASEMRPMEWEMENNIVIAKEKLSLLPLYAIAQDLEDSDCDLDDLKDWYKEALGGVRMVTGDVHTNECLKYRQMTHDMCDYSTTCPRRYSQRFLLFPSHGP